MVAYTDHKNLEYFNCTKSLNPCQAHWAEVLSSFDFVISYHPGDKNGKADALSRRMDPELEGGSAPQMSMFKLGQLAQIQENGQLLVQLLSPKCKVPIASTTLVAGYDLYSAEELQIAPHSRSLVCADTAIFVPPGTYGRIAPCSGLSVNNSIDIGAGVIDADYDGPVKILLIYHANTSFQVKEGDRVAQPILECVQTPDTATIDALPETEQGEQGFGSTGVASANQVILECKVMLIPARSVASNKFADRIIKAGALDKQWTSYKMALESGRLFDNLILEDELVCYKNRICIPDCNDLKLTVTRQAHNTKVVGHFGRDKTLELLTRNYYWPNLDEWVKT